MIAGLTTRGRSGALIPDYEGATRYLPWVIAVMVFLGGLAIAAGYVGQNLASGVYTRLTGTITVEIPVLAGQDRAARTARALDILRATAGIIQVRALDRRELVDLLEPWLGRGNITDDLPVPQLIHVGLDRGHPADLNFLARRLNKEVPGARIDDHHLWAGKLKTFVEAVQALAVGTTGLVLLAVALVVAFAARAALAAHSDIVALLYTLGAHDSFVAGHFQRTALAMGLKGGLVGLLLALAVVLALATFLDGDVLPLRPAMVLEPLYLLLMVLLPLTAAAVAVVTARLTVLRNLRRLP